MHDWHPGSDGKVLDLVHPSLYPLVYGRTRILRHSTVKLDDAIQKCGEGEIAQATMAQNREGLKSYSKRFQWLPCEVQICNDVKYESIAPSMPVIVYQLKMTGLRVISTIFTPPRTRISIKSLKTSSIRRSRFGTQR